MNALPRGFVRVMPGVAGGTPVVRDFEGSWKRTPGKAAGGRIRTPGFKDERVLRRAPGESGDHVAWLGAGVEQIREIEAYGRAIIEYGMVRGPRPEDIPQLRAYGYQPDAVARIEEERLERERQLAEMLAAGTTDRSRLSDIVHARYLFWELRDHLREDLHPYGITIDEFFANGKDWLSAFLDDIPAAAITITLTEKSFRNQDKKWKGNDLRDADAMSAAVPYCDVVLTDKYVAAQLAKSPAVRGQGALVLPRLRDLADQLPDLVTGHNPST